VLVAPDPGRTRESPVTSILTSLTNLGKGILDLKELSAA